MNYYEVEVKCGHVGRGHYIIKKLYIKAETGKEAATTARAVSRVKHHQKDAIVSVRGVTLEEYCLGLRANSEDPYFKCHCKQEQIRLEAVCPEEIMSETKQTSYKKQRTGQRIRYETLLKDTDKYLLGGKWYEQREDEDLY